MIAPYGLDDLFAMRIRRNPARVSVKTFRQRVAQKQYAQRWPRVQIEDAE
ncbi:MAG: nucleotidyltransferase family protein [Paucibacter sp.]|nr:nucleotidyltransferase family protein [Roseateles sp.]